MMRRPLVGIVLATYEPDISYLKQQLDSILGQSYSDFFVLLTDDGSSPSKKKEVQSLIEGKENVFAEFSANRGTVQNFAFGIGCALSRGAEYIALCDQDDIWITDKLSNQLECILETQSALVHCDLTVISAEGLELSPSIFRLEHRRRKIENFSQIFFKNNVTGCACIFTAHLARKALPFPEVKKVNPQFYHDHWLACVAFFEGGITFLPRSLVRYRQHGLNQVGAGRKKSSSENNFSHMVQICIGVAESRSMLLSELSKLYPGTARICLKVISLNISEMKELIIFWIGRIFQKKD